MTELSLSPDAQRFLRTLRIAAASAVAGYDFSHAAPKRTTTSFLALAAKGRDDWRFPAGGLLSTDGLLRAALVEDAAGARSLALQALGAAGLTRYAGLSVVLKLATGRRIAAKLDADGGLRLPLAQNELNEIDLAGFDIEMADDAS